MGQSQPQRPAVARAVPRVPAVAPGTTSLAAAVSPSGSDKLPAGCVTREPTARAPLEGTDDGTAARSARAHAVVLTLWPGY